MPSSTPMPAILKLKSATENGCSDCEFGMMERAFQPKFWNRAAQDITASRGIRERARQIGADLTIWSRAGTGTEIELSLAGSIAYVTSPRRSRFRIFQRKWDEK